MDGDTKIQMNQCVLLDSWVGVVLDIAAGLFVLMTLTCH